MPDFKIGDVVKLKGNLDPVIYHSFLKSGISKELNMKICKIRKSLSNGLAFEGGWEYNNFRSRFFELTINRKERISNLFKEDKND